MVDGELPDDLLLYCEGYLTKRGNGFKTWKRRYFRLDPERQCLDYFTAEDEARAKLKGSVAYAGGTVVIDDASECHRFLLRAPGRDLHMQADNRDDMLMWAKALRLAVADAATKGKASATAKGTSTGEA